MSSKFIYLLLTYLCILLIALTDCNTTPAPVEVFTPTPENLLTKIPEKSNDLSSCEVSQELLTPSTPELPQPLIVDAISGGSTQAVAVDGNLIYTNVGGQLLVLEQKEAPFSLQVVGCLQFPEEIKYIRSSDNYVFVFLTENIISVGETEVYVIDATNPKQLTLVSVYEYPFLEPSVNNGYLFAVGSGFKLYVIKVADPDAWYVAGQSESLGSGSLVEIRILNDYAYVITTLGASEFPELHIFDVSNPTRPVLLGSYDAPLDVITSVAVSGDYIFILTELDPNMGDVLDPPYWLYILDASHP